jgi:hypothetical protein
MIIIRGWIGELVWYDVVLVECLCSYPAQLVVLTAQIAWTEDVDEALQKNQPLEAIAKSVDKWLNMLADSVLQEQPPLRRKKLEHLVGHLFCAHFHVYRSPNLCTNVM